MRRRLRLWVATGGHRYRAREEAAKEEEEALEGWREKEVGPRAAMETVAAVMEAATRVEVEMD